jgi:hypothetical protein
MLRRWARMSADKATPWSCLSLHPLAVSPRLPACCIVCHHSTAHQGHELHKAQLCHVSSNVCLLGAELTQWVGGAGAPHPKPQ